LACPYRPAHLARLQAAPCIVLTPPVSCLIGGAPSSPATAPAGGASGSNTGLKDLGKRLERLRLQSEELLLLIEDEIRILARGGKPEASMAKLGDSVGRGSSFFSLSPFLSPFIHWKRFRIEGLLLIEDEIRILARGGKPEASMAKLGDSVDEERSLILSLILMLLTYGSSCLGRLRRGAWFEVDPGPHHTVSHLYVVFAPPPPHTLLAQVKRYANEYAQLLRSQKEEADAAGRDHGPPFTEEEMTGDLF
jgi:hypothetical protein